ncbi:hypothetical protein K523DRAFT_358333 [Schizophyllum commune Tattone D]|nr:hypothetical protein K523DRAFT_358333 [Schizophyllum commune Tattone D]
MSHSRQRSHRCRKDDEDEVFRFRAHRATDLEVSDDLRRVREVTEHITAPQASSSRSSSRPQIPPPSIVEPHEDFTLTQGDEFFESYNEAEEIVCEPAPTYERADPVAEWESLRAEYLDECLRFEGRGVHRRCLTCNSVDARYRCRDECMGHWLHCQDCIVKAHRLLPLHWIERWDDQDMCFCRSSLSKLGLRVQLGHLPGDSCLQPVAAHHDFTILHTNGIHIVSVAFCGCGNAPTHHRQQLMRNGWWPGTSRSPQTCTTLACLRQFHKLNTSSKISVYEYHRAIERLTDNTGTILIHEKRRVFGDIVYQYRHIASLERAGRGHVNNGVVTTQPGALAIRCPACPQPGRNLPEGWDSVGPERSFLYQKFVAQDANFRLSNAMRSSEARDRPLGDGWAYFVPRRPYMEYVTSFANEEDISSCSRFAAVFLANLKRARGLRATGVAAVICSRHNIFLPNGMGDLQKGERFCNMTYVLASALSHEEVKHVVYSYDIACIFDKKLMERVATLPRHLRTRIADLVFRYFVPNFHLPAHRSSCHAPYSFHFAPWVGKTHGETVEENWFILNKAAAQTKPMGPGRRQLTLDDQTGCHDHEMVLGLERYLPKRMVRTVRSYMSSYSEFDQLHDGIVKRNPVLITEWLAAERCWQEDKTGAPCPYEISTSVQTMKDVELALQQEETQRTADGSAVVQEVTVSAFVKHGIDTQHMQRLLHIEVKTLKNPTSAQQLNIFKKRTVLRKHVDKLRRWQRIYMPSVREHLSDEQRQEYDSIPDNIEDMRLFLPSELPELVREAVCGPGVAKAEEAFRQAETEETLEDIRRGLRARTATNQYRQANARGITMATRARAVFDKIAKRIHIGKIRYRFARNCLLRLRGHGPWESRLRPLEDHDVRALNERAMTAKEREDREHARALGHNIDWAAEEGVVLTNVVNAGEGSRRLSWIWYTDPGSSATTGEGHLNEALRVEYLKSKARRDRDREEIQLLEEEMRRTIASLEYDSEMWRQRAQSRTECDEVLADGLRSYAHEHAAICRERAALLKGKWSPIRKAGQLALTLLFDDIEPLADEGTREELEDTLDGIGVNQDDVEDDPLMTTDFPS